METVLCKARKIGAQQRLIFGHYRFRPSSLQKHLSSLTLPLRESLPLPARGERVGVRGFGGRGRFVDEFGDYRLALGNLPALAVLGDGHLFVECCGEQCRQVFRWPPARVARLAPLKRVCTGGLR